MNTLTQDMTEFSTIAEARRLANFLPDLREYVAKMERNVENRVYLALQKQALTPEGALSAWMEKAAYHHLLTRLEQQARFGMGLAEKKAPMLNPLPV